MHDDIVDEAEGEPISTSPRVVHADHDMDWPHAQYRLLDGRRLTRREWHDPTVCIFLGDGRLKLRKADRTVHDLIVSDGDMCATDWIFAQDN